MRTLTNGVESILYIIGFYYFLDVNHQFNKTSAIMTAVISLAFMMRNTSVVGWIPLLLLKIVHENAFFNFLKAGFLVAIPVVAICILSDSLYFGQLTISSYNFLQANLTEGLSKYFGTDPFDFYIREKIPELFPFICPILYFSFFYFTKKSYEKNQTPYMTYCVVFYILIFSLIEHKETRFLTPIMPFCFLMIGYVVNENIYFLPRV